MRNLGLLILCGALAACGDTALKNPDAFTAKTENGLTTGTYNPAGFTSESIQKFVCNVGKPTNYAEKPLDNGLIAFSTNCV